MQRSSSKSTSLNPPRSCSRRLMSEVGHWAPALSLASALVGCAPEERSFGDSMMRDAAVESGRSDAISDDSTGDGSDGGGPTDETRGRDNSDTDVESSVSSANDSGAQCEPVVCPEDTECRGYRQPDACRTQCQIHDEPAETACDSGNGQCDGHGECVVPNLATLGETCASDDECGSHHCAPTSGGDQVCCDTACDGACTSCSSDGHCVDAPSQDGACEAITCEQSSACVSYPESPTIGVCAGFAQCATADDYCSPDFVAADEACGEGMVCDGQGACVYDCPDVTGAERVCTPECPCGTGEGVCESTRDCQDGLVCTSDAMAKLGFPASSCLPAHCTNDEQDEDETSVDCGGGCGCRATYEVVLISGVPGDASFGQLTAMSGDGSAFSGAISRAGDRFSPPYPARIDAHGVVTELPGFGVQGTAFGINTDGSVVVGDLWCDDPPDCTTAEFYSPFRWADGGAPTSAFRTGSAIAVSASGAIIAGNQYDATSGLSLAFRVSANRSIDIPQLSSVLAMSADGEYIAGQSSSTGMGAVWSATLDDLVPLEPPSEWTSWTIESLSDDGSAFAGYAYIGNTPSTFIWKDGSFSNFPMLPGADYTHPYGLSSDGSVAAGLSGTNSLQRAFLWDETNGIRTVLAETVARGLELPVDLELIGVDYMSDDGAILVGWNYGVEPPSFWRVTLLP